RLKGDRHRSAIPAGRDELLDLVSLALVLRAARPRRAASPTCPDRRLPEVVELRTLASSCGVYRLLREARVAGRGIRNGRAGAAAESDSGLKLIVLGARYGVDLLGQAAHPPAQCVDEVTAFTG